MKRIILLFLMILVCLSLSACTTKQDVQNDSNDKNAQEETSDVVEGSGLQEELKYIEQDYSANFNGINGCIVLIDTQMNTGFVYNETLAQTQQSPCSTFKVVSSLIGLGEGIIQDANTTMGYEGKSYPITEWNADLNFEEAFRSSCVWYFRKVIDQVGRDKVQLELDALNYGNKDISEWEGSNVNPSEDLNGFWLESSLLISPLEQVEVLRDIFGGNSQYSQESISILKEAMFYEDADIQDGKLYGKTGTGINGHVWFVGLLEKDDNIIYFATYLNDTENASTDIAKEISFQVLNSLK